MKGRRNEGLVNNWYFLSTSKGGLFVEKAQNNLSFTEPSASDSNSGQERSNLKRVWAEAASKLMPTSVSSRVNCSPML